MEELNFKNKVKFALFNQRTGMYVRRVNRDAIEAFIVGYEVATQNKSYSENIRVLLRDKYNFEGGACGWPYALELYAKSKNIEWVDAYKEIGTEVTGYDRVPIEDVKQIDFTERPQP